MKKKLYRSKHDNIVLGVCGGLAAHFKMDSTIVRLIFVFLCILTAIIPMVIIYFIAALMIPMESSGKPLKMPKHKLYRSVRDRKIAGICGGLAESTKLDPVFLRLLFIFVCLMTAIVPFVLIYVVAWIIIPEKR